MRGEQRRQSGIEQVRVSRATTVMEQAADDPNSQIVKPTQPDIVPAPIADLRVIGSDGLPNDGVAQRTNSKRGDAIQIVQPILVTSIYHLIPEPLSDAGHGALHASPNIWMRVGPRTGLWTHGVLAGCNIDMLLAALTSGTD